MLDDPSPPTVAVTPAATPAVTSAAAIDGHASVAGALLQAFAATGTSRLFGLPGGGSSLDLIEAARLAGIPFVLARHECSAVFMAAATAELDGSIGVAITTKGPGTANAVNGAAHASLDRCPVAIVTDGFTPAAQAFVTHQWFDQRALLAPVVKDHALLDGPDAGDEIVRLTTRAFEFPRGPVHVELTGPAARAHLEARRFDAPSAQAGAPGPALTEARALLARARRPVVVAGLEACGPQAARALRALVDTLGCPALVTYKAKGVVPDASPHYAGIFTGGAAEQPAVGSADLIVLAGLDPVELIAQRWAYDVPVLDIAAVRHRVHYVEPVIGVYGRLEDSLDALATTARPAGWSRRETRRLRSAMLDSLAYCGDGSGLTPQQVVEAAARAAAKRPRWPRVTVDAGAHMFSATAFWPCREPRDLLISNGLATMGFALPAAIASVLHEPDRPAIAFTGDGGLLMCLGELATAVETGGALVIVVFNDGALSLIDIKQQQRQLPVEGVRWDRPDFAAIMRALGGNGWRVASLPAYRRALSQALAGGRPALIDVQVDASGYPRQLAALRG